MATNNSRTAAKTKKNGKQFAKVVSTLANDMYVRTAICQRKYRRNYSVTSYIARA